MTERAVAIVGVAAIMPDAPDAATFWRNIKDGRYSISDVPPERWDPALYYDPDPAVPDKTYSKIGGWVRDFEWSPLAWKLPVPPRVGDAMDDAQKWAVNLARAALLDYGWPERGLDHERTAVVIGNALAGERHYQTALRISFPEFARELERSATFARLAKKTRAAVIEETRQGMRSVIPAITEDTMPGELANVLAGRIANLFDFRGPSYVTDAACASGLAAMAASVEGLVNHEYDTVLTGGIDRNMGIAAYVKFCKIGALSATGTRPYGDGADGFVMGEGGTLFLLKRLADAERDGDRVYAVLLGMGGSSDGRGKGITAPNPVGQRLAVRRAWDLAGVDPSTCSLIEGHGTSTAVGDVVEVEALADVFGRAPVGSIPLGSVKSNIGHLKAAAGTAGVFKATMALHHKVLPVTLHAEHPNPDIDFARSPFLLNTELRPWDPPPAGIRRAGVSAFGFGGTNFHAVLEEYVPGRHRDTRRTSFAGAEVPKTTTRGVFVAGAADDAGLVDRLRAVAPPAGPPSPDDLGAAVRIAIDYGDARELADKAARALRALEREDQATWRALRSQGVFLGRGPRPKVAFLYTGQGSQYVNMLRSLSHAYPVVADTFAEADAVMTPLLGRPLTDYVFLDDASEDTVAQAEKQLLRTEITQPAVLAADIALTRLLAAHGITPDLVMGHSLGEYGALVAAGSLSFADALRAVSARGTEMAHVSVADNGAMAAVFAPVDEVERVLASIDGYVVVANVNSTRQAVIGGATAAVEAAVRVFAEAGRTAVRLPVSHAFHTSIVAPASEPLRRVLRGLELKPPTVPVVANVDGELYPETVAEMVDVLGRQVASPVQFVKGLYTLYAQGARVFVEVGPKKALHGFAADVLEQRYGDAVALFTNHPKQGDLVSFNQALCGLYAAGLGTPRPTERTTVDTKDRYTQLGHLLAEFLDRSTALYQGTAVPGPRQVDTGPPEPVVITGAALGLPGTERVFDDENLAKILAGQQFISPIPESFRQAMADKHITRLVKSENGAHRFDAIDSSDDVIKLAARAGAFDLVDEFGVDDERAKALGECTRLAIGAGFDALRDAGIPLVLHYKTTTVGTRMPDRWGLPDSLRDSTGVIFASAFPGLGEFADEVERYLAEKYRRRELAALRAMKSSVDSVELDHRIAQLTAEIDAEPFAFDRRFLFRVLSMGHSQFAEIIGARGPNTQINSACASTTQAVALAEDWIRAGRCRRVVVVAADDATSDSMLPWVGAGFLASGAAATDDKVENAALPFDNRRHGMLLGMGAAGIVVESAEAARERGVQPICQVLASVTANSAFHGTKLDVHHISAVMADLLDQAGRRGVDRHAIAPETVFVSHETYTPARGGSAQAEIDALRAVFGADADKVIIANTKGFTGHPMGVGIEDVVAVKALETGIVPPVPNFQEVDPSLGQLHLSTGGDYPVRYALRLAAGFGSQISMVLLRWTPVPDGRHRAPGELGHEYRIVDRPAWQRWLTEISGTPDARLEVDHRRLRVADRSAPVPEVPTVDEPVRDDVTGTVVALVAEQTGYPAEMLELDLDLEADLGVDTVKQAEVFAAIRERFGIERDDTLRLRDYPTLNHVISFVRERAGLPAESVAAQPVSDDVTGVILALVAEQTGYPTEMLELDLDLEADLGVDTVKQAEVFAAIRERFGIERDDTLRLRDYPTLNHVIGFVRDRIPSVEEPTQDDVTETVLALVAEQTGYPTEMLELDLDLEADLGVDTVKQAEVFAAIRERFGIERDDTLRLRDYPTLNHVIGFVNERATGASTTAQPAEAEQVEAASEFPRRVPVPTIRPPFELCAPTGVELAAGKRVVVATDQGGVAAALIEKLTARGVEVVATDDITGRIDGVYWLTALDHEGPIDQMDLTAWRAANQVRVKDLYATMRRLHDQETFLVSATRLGGRHGYDDAGAYAPLGGAVTGFTKAYGRERTDALVKAVDFGPEAEPAAVADLLIEETLRDPGALEVGHADGLRWTVTVTEQPNTGDGMPLGPDTVFVVTGAAGGIVSAITKDLAQASGGIFHLLDLTPEPDPDDPDIARFDTDKDGLRDKIIERLRQTGERATPVQVERELARYERLAAARHAIDAVRAAGGRAHYHSVDLTDGDAVARAMAEVPDRIDVLLHAAGLDISHALADKDKREYDLVFGVKSDGWFNVMRAIGDRPLGAVVSFSSVAGRFGNVGQTDYSAANDLLCKLTSATKNTRAIAIDWTAWADIGMASRGSIPKVMAMAGIEMLPPHVGIPTIRRELTGGAGRGEIVVAGRLGALVAERADYGGVDPARFEPGPMAGEVDRMGVYDGLVVRTTLDPAEQPFLRDHQIDGTPVLPGVLGVEGFAEVVAMPLPGWRAVEITDVEFLAPYKFYKGQPRTLTITATYRLSGDDLVADCRLIGTRHLAGQAEPQVTTHFTGTVRLTPVPAETLTVTVPPTPDGTGVAADAIYGVYFHGPAFQVLDRAWLDERGPVGLYANELPADHVPADRPEVAFPRLVELVFQTAGVWEIGRHGRFGLPRHVDRITLRTPPEGRVEALVTADGDGFDGQVVDEAGTVVLDLAGYRTVELPGALDSNQGNAFAEAMT